MFLLKRQGVQINKKAQRVAILQQISIQRRQHINTYRVQILAQVNKQNIAEEPVIKQPVIEEKMLETIIEEPILEDDEESVIDVFTEDPIVEFIGIYKIPDENYL